MFLPVLLVRDLGIWGWVVFAIPNVVGAAAMGWVLRTADASRGIVERHRGACAAFSAITIAFHVFFVLWFVPRLVGLPAASGVFALTAIYLLATIRQPAVDLPVAALVWGLSLAMFALFLRRLPNPAVPVRGSLPPIDGLWLAPVCIFGFLTCPYLDLTFHRARQHTTASEARLAFGVGFGLCFFVMIVFSLFYAGQLAPLLSPKWRQYLRPAIGTVIAVHMISQTAFTLSAHARSFASVRVGPGGVFGLLGLSQLALLLGLGSYLLPRYHGMDAGEVVYRLFMAFYGLVFPAYVWIRMVPRGQGQAWPDAPSIRALVLGIAVAAPMYWMGFVENRMIWLLPGVAAVVLARYAIPRRIRVLA